MSKQMYTMLKQQINSLKKQLSGEAAIPNEIPKDFNQKGWDLTIASVENMLTKMKEARDVKGKRMTPQFFRSIFNRTVLADSELDKFIESVTAVEDTNIDYGAECIRLTAELHELNQQKLAQEQEPTNA